jgi:hypothetical protein
MFASTHSLSGYSGELFVQRNRNTAAVKKQMGNTVFQSAALRVRSIVRPPENLLIFLPAKANTTYYYIQFHNLAQPSPCLRSVIDENT